MTAPIPVTSVIVTLHNGVEDACVPNHFSTFGEASAWLRYRERSIAATRDDGECRVTFRMKFADGQMYRMGFPLYRDYPTPFGGAWYDVLGWVRYRIAYGAGCLSNPPMGEEEYRRILEERERLIPGITDRYRTLHDRLGALYGEMHQ